MNAIQMHTKIYALNNWHKDELSPGKSDFSTEASNKSIPLYEKVKKIKKTDK